MTFITLRNISKIYRVGEIECCALNNVSLDIHTGEFLVIMGPSGSGKTTLMNVIGCLDRPTSGEFILNEETVSTLSDEKLSKVRNQHIGFVFQAFYLLNTSTVLENVILPLQYCGNCPYEERVKRGIEILKLVGLGDRMYHTPLQLSGGQQQRVAIARALINNPKIVCADEPTGNLDSKTGQGIMEIFKELHRKGITIVLVTHDQEIAGLGGKTVHLRDGTLINQC